MIFDITHEADADMYSSCNRPPLPALQDTEGGGQFPEPLLNWGSSVYKNRCSSVTFN